MDAHCPLMGAPMDGPSETSQDLQTSLWLNEPCGARQGLELDFFGFRNVVSIVFGKVSERVWDERGVIGGCSPRQRSYCIPIRRMASWGKDNTSTSCETWTNNQQGHSIKVYFTQINIIDTIKTNTNKLDSPRWFPFGGWLVHSR